MIYLIPNGGKTELDAVDVDHAFPQIGYVQKRVVSSLAALKEKILVFEAGLDDRAVELVKLALASVVEKKDGQKPQEGYFSFADEEKNRIGFVFFFPGKPEAVLKRPGWTLIADPRKLWRNSIRTRKGLQQWTRNWRRSFWTRTKKRIKISAPSVRRF